MAGLQAATELHKKNIPFLLVDQDLRPGGRIKTDLESGFRLDHGFQVLQTNYPQVLKSLDLSALKLSAFDSGAKLWHEGRWVNFLNPLRQGFRFLALVPSLISVKDLILLGRLWLKIQWLGDSLADTQESTADFLRRWGFSERFRSTFLEPFFRGIYLDSPLRPSASLFFFFMRQFLVGEAALPAEGMGAVALQLMDALPHDSLRLGTAVVQIDANHLVLENGDRLEFEQLIIALNPAATAKLLGLKLSAEALLGVKTFYFSAPARAVKRKLLHLLPAESGLLHYCFLSHIAPSYAPEGYDLLEVSTLDLNVCHQEVLESLANYEEVGDLHFLKAYTIPQSLPLSGYYSELQAVAEAKGYILAGDYTVLPSLQGAMLSGQMAAEIVRHN